MAAFLLLVFWIFLGRTAGWQTPAAARYEAWDGTEKRFLASSMPEKPKISRGFCI